MACKGSAKHSAVVMRSSNPEWSQKDKERALSLVKKMYQPGQLH